MMEFPSTAFEKLIQRGTILHSHMFEEIDHGKFFLIIGVSDDMVAGFFYINSNVNRALFSKPLQLGLQYPIRKEDYHFLHHDSFVCASSLVKMKRTSIVNSIIDGRTKYIDSMKKEHLEELLASLLDSPLYSNIEKRKFFHIDDL